MQTVDISKAEAEAENKAGAVLQQQEPAKPADFQSEVTGAMADPGDLESELQGLQADKLLEGSQSTPESLSLVNSQMKDPALENTGVVQNNMVVTSLEEELKALQTEDTTTTGGGRSFEAETPIMSPEEKAFKAQPLYQQVAQNTSNILKNNAASFGALINAGLANLNEAVGLDSKLYRENQSFWKGLADQTEEALTYTYGDKEGLPMMVAKEVGNPLNYTFASLAGLGGIMAVDSSKHQAIGDKSGQGMDMRDVGAVALSTGAGLIAGKLIEPTVRILGNSASAILDSWRLRGLPDNIKDAIKSGDNEQLERILREFKISDDMGAGDLPFGGKYGTTTNTFEAKIAKKLVGKVEQEAIPVSDEILNKAKPTDVTAEGLYQAVKTKEKYLKNPMTEAYNNSVHSASTEPKFDMEATNQEIIDDLKQEGAGDVVINHVMKQLYSKGRHLTPPQKAAQASISKLKKSIEADTKKIKAGEGNGVELEKKIKANYEAIQDAERTIAKAGTEESQRVDELKSAISSADAEVRSLNDQYLLGGSKNEALATEIAQKQAAIGKLKIKLPNESPLFSEKELINSVRGITHKITTPGSDVSINDEEAQYLLGKARGMLGKKAESLFEGSGSGIFKEFQRANGLARKYHDYASGMQEIQLLLKSKSVLPEEVLVNLMNNPVRLKQLINITEDPKLGGELAKQTLSHILTPKKQAIAGSLARLDMKSTANQLNSVFSDKSVTEFFKKHLTKNQFKDVEALRNVTSSFNKMVEELPEGVTGWEYIKGADGLVNTGGRFLKTLYDGIGYGKNSLLETMGTKGVGPIKSSRIYPDTKILEKATKLMSDKLQQQGVASPDGYRLPIFTPAETKVLEQATESIKSFFKKTTIGAGTQQTKEK